MAALSRTARAFELGGSSAPDAAHQAQGVIYGTLLKQAAMLSFSDAFFIMGILFLVIVPLMFMIKKTAPPKQPILVE